MADEVVTSFGVLNYAGMLFNKGNIKTPLLSILGGRQKYTQSVEFILGQEFTPEEGEIPNISESASLSAPDAKKTTRSQKTNVTQIFQEALYISYAKMSNMNTLAGANIAGQAPNPKTELDFQAGSKLMKIGRSIEKTLIQGTFNKATTDAEVNKTRGIIEAITQNIVTGNGASLDIWLVNDLLQTIDENGGDTTDLVLWLNGTQINQLNGSAVENGLTIAPSERDINGIRLKELILPNGTVRIYKGEYVPNGTALLLNLNAMSLVEQPVPSMGNFFLEPLGKSGAGEKYQIFGQIGLDYSNELLHGKITGLSTTFTKPLGRKVQLVSA